MQIEHRPVIDKDGNPVLYDIFIDDQWHGSRRTIGQCELYCYWFEHQDEIKARLEEAAKKFKEEKERFKKYRIEKQKEQESTKDYSAVDALLDKLFETEKQRIATTDPAKIENWLVGQVMKSLKGYDPMIVKEKIKEKLA